MEEENLELKTMNSDPCRQKNTAIGSYENYWERENNKKELFLFLLHLKIPISTDIIMGLLAQWIKSTENIFKFFLLVMT